MKEALSSQLSALSLVLASVLIPETLVSADQSDRLRRLAIDPSSSQITIQVGRSGVFGFAGHDHEVVGPIGSGEIALDSSNLARSSVTLTIATRSLKVTGKGEPKKDVPAVQDAMERDVLDVARHPTIRFESRQVKVTSPSESTPALAITGDLTLGGVTRPITVPAQVRLDGRSLTATGTVSIKQTEFGIKPVSAVGGTVKVRDELRITFRISAR
ncbi:MAG: YceI family protein [Acidobacteria bacterium]|nr:YceI family protein [Acidobacteriota bacterium]MBI3262583.1 YceI family protein [Acidobacteriota bacterium]